jgi:hypothetical protein
VNDDGNPRSTKARFCGHEGRFPEKKRRFDSPFLSPRLFHISPSPHPLPDLTHSNTSLRPTPTASPTQQSSPQLLRFSLPVHQSPILGLPQTPLLHGIPFVRPFRGSPRPHPVTALDTCSALSPVTLNGPRTEPKGTGWGCVGSIWAGQGMSLVGHVTPTRVPSRPGKKLTSLPRLWT